MSHVIDSKVRSLFVVLVLAGAAASSSRAIAQAPLPKAMGIPPEPKYPPPCATLLANKTAVNDTLAAADENLPDTTRARRARRSS